MKKTVVFAILFVLGISLLSFVAGAQYQANKHFAQTEQEWEQEQGFQDRARNAVPTTTASGHILVVRAVYDVDEGGAFVDLEDSSAGLTCLGYVLFATRPKDDKLLIDGCYKPGENIPALLGWKWHD